MSIRLHTAAIPPETGRMGRHKKFGVITIILGLAAMMAPVLSGESVALFVGLLVIAAGVLRMIWAFSAGSFGRGVLVCALGGHTLLSGLTLLGDPLLSSALLMALIAVLLFADGVADLVGAFRVPRDAGRRWMLVGGAASISLGLMIWRQFPLVGGWSLGVLLGIRLLLIGMVMFTSGSAVRALAKATGRTGCSAAPSQPADARNPAHPS